MIEIVIALIALATPLVYTLIAVKLGVYLERRRVSSRLRQLPLDQEAFESMLDSLGLDDNPLDRRSLGQE